MPAPAEIDAPTLQRLLAEGRAVLIDVREQEEFDDEHIPGARLVPLSGFDPQQVAAMAAGRPIVLHCLSGKRAEKAAAALAPHHGTVMIFRDGLFGWKSAGFPTEPAAGTAN
jgi:rhodanese-related sulfurtransferase